MKKIILLISLCCILIGCHSERVNEEPPVPEGIKPVIFYKNRLYWMEGERPSYELTDGYIASGDEIIESEKDSSTVPSRECFTSAKNSNNVGAAIYINPNDPNAIIIFTGEKYITFLYE